MKKAVPATGTPMAPASISLRQVCCAPPRKVSGAQPTRRPRVLASSSNGFASAVATPKGFSEWTCLPARSARSPTSTWASGTVRLTTMAIDGSASRASTGMAWMPNSTPRFTAISGIMSATARTERIGNPFAALR